MPRFSETDTSAIDEWVRLVAADRARGRPRAASLRSSLPRKARSAVALAREVGIVEVVRIVLARRS